MGAASLQLQTDASMTGPLAGKIVLIVEDDSIIAEGIFDTLSDAGARPMAPCATIAEALTAINGQAIDVALVDVNLNGMRSHAVMQALHAKNIPFIAATAYQFAASLGGAPVILEKPYTPEKLREAMTRALAADAADADAADHEPGLN
jgi:CheY-like chemotaxis protein